MSGLALVKSSCSFCMSIILPLLTVAIVSVVSAKAGSEKPASATAPSSPFTRTFIAFPPVRHAHLGICQASGRIFAISLGASQCGFSPTCAKTRIPVKKPAFWPFFASDSSLQQMLRGRLVGDQAGNEPPGERAAHRRPPRRSHSDADHESVVGAAQGGGGDPLVRAF